MHRWTILTACILFIATLVFPQHARAQGMGLTVGANFQSLSDVDAGNTQATFDNVAGWHVHLWFDFPIGPVAIRPGIRYMGLGELFDQARVQDDITTIVPDNTVVSLLEVPIDLRFRLRLPLVTPYVVAGPVLRFPAPPRQDDGEILESFSMAGGAGVGVELALGRMRLYPELKYTFGISSFTQDEYQIGGVTVRTDDSQQLNVVMLSLGIRM